MCFTGLDVCFAETVPGKLVRNQHQQAKNFNQHNQQTSDRAHSPQAAPKKLIPPPPNHHPAAAAPSNRLQLSVVDHPDDLPVLDRLVATLHHGTEHLDETGEVLLAPPVEVASGGLRVKVEVG